MNGPSVAHGAPLDPEALARPLVTAFAQSIEALPDGRFVFVSRDGGTASCGYGEVFARARRILSRLRREGMVPGDRVIVHLDRAEDFTAALWAVILGGGVPVPLARSDWSRYHARRVPQLFGMFAEVLGRPRVLTDAAIGEGGLDAVALAGIDAEPESLDFHAARPDDERLIVLTSGTTARPNLVALPDRALLVRWWPALPAAGEARAFLSWSPLDHVLGLGLVAPNLPLKVHLPVDLFVRSPLAWFEAVERHSITHATMTNFGMDLIGKALAADPGRRFDLSSLRKVGIGAEAISPEVCRRFFDALSRFGAPPDAIILGYGLTECGPLAGGDTAFVPAGMERLQPELDRPTRGHGVRIVDGDGAIVPEGTGGRVEVCGPTMTLGYVGDKEGTARLFTPDGWLRTGDLGVLRKGRLTITGREKEIIVVNARKYACLEIEAVALSVPGVEAAYAAALAEGDGPSGPDGGFGIAYVASAGAPADRGAAIAAAIAAAFGMAPARLVGLPAEAIPRTPSGKVRRAALAALFPRRSEDPAPVSRKSAGAPVSGSVTERIAAMFAAILEVAEIPPNEDFFDLGGDSIAATRLAFDLEAAFGRSPPQALFLEQTTVARLAAYYDGDVVPPQPLVKAGGFDPAIEARLRMFTESWPGERPFPEALSKGVGAGAAAPPIFWCLQGARQLRRLADALGPDRPVYGLRSGHLAMEYTAANIVALAERYALEINRIAASGPVVLGGICQGGRIAAEIARCLDRQGRRVELLVLVDTPGDALGGVAYPGKVLIVSARRSRFNPLRRFRSPEAGWRKFMPGGFRHVVLPADHPFANSRRAVRLLARALAPALEWAGGTEAAPPTGGDEALPAPFPDTAYRMRLDAPSPLVIVAGEPAEIDVAVTNCGSVAWPPAAASGIALGNHWLSRRGEVLVWADGRAPLDTGLRPGATAGMRIAIRPPAKPGRYWLELDLVEEGITWFKDRGADTAIVRVVVARAPRRRSWLRRLFAGAGRTAPASPDVRSGGAARPTAARPRRS